ncbi:MAG: hypothetical protein H7146_13970 [Burkholderiaceae bacterium]|nr:hypothetical protein [Microbacteriaceae bacterium]
MKLQKLLDRMIDLTRERDPDGAYCVLVGTAPVTDAAWVHEVTSYRDLAVAQSRLVPNYLVVIAPSPGHPAGGEVVELQGDIPSGQVTHHTVRHG